MLIYFKVCYWPSFDKGLNKHHLLRVLLNWQGKFEFLAALKHLIKGIEILHLESEVDLLNEGPLQRRVADGYFVWRGYEGGKIADEEKDIDISFDIGINIRVPHLHCYFLSFVFGLVDLAHWTWGDWGGIEVVEDLAYLFTVGLTEILLGGFVWVVWRLLSEILEFGGELWADYISSMAEVLESFDEDNSWAFDGFHKEIHPVVFSPFEKYQRREEEGGDEKDQKLKESYHIAETTPDHR